MTDSERICARCGDPNDGAHPWCGTCRAIDRFEKLGRADEAAVVREHRSEAEFLRKLAGNRWPTRMREVVNA